MMSNSQEQRPQFFDDPASDRLTAIITALCAEVASGIDRAATLETILIEKGVLSLGEIDNRLPDERESAVRQKKHQEFIGRVFYVIKQEFDALK